MPPARIPVCPHTCCLVPFDQDHLHLFSPRECPDCQALAAVARHPANRHREELEP